MKPPLDGPEIADMLQKALQLQTNGQLTEAEKLYRQILENVPDHADALHLLGCIHLAQGDMRRAKEFIERAIEGDNTAPTFHVSLGDVLQAQGHLDAAVICYRDALRLRPAMPAALCNMGNALREQGKLAEAISCYRRCLSVNPALPEVFNNLGLAYHRQQQHKLAIDCFQKALAVNPNYADAHNNLGNVYREQENFEAAFAQYRQALALAPENAAVNYNLGVLLHMRRDLEQADIFYRKAIELQPHMADAHHNLGKLHRDRNRLQEAIDCYARAIRIDPAHADAHFNRSLAWLALGNFQEGWREYEWRFKRRQHRKIYPHRLAGPCWDGSSFRGQRILVHSEQGFGDILQFVRYLPLVKSRGGEVIFETRPELCELLQNFPGIDRLVEMSGQPLPRSRYDLYVPLMSLPAIFQTTLETIPTMVPYLQAPSGKHAAWRQRLKTSGFKVGLTWASKPTHDAESCRLVDLLPLLRLDAVQVYGLQKGEAAKQVVELPVAVINLGDEFASFADTAAAMDCLDLVISVDTSVAHLAGAMGKPVWVLLPFCADWRWLQDRQDSPWYPTMRLFRQPRPGDWPAVVDLVAAELKSTVSSEMMHKSR